MKGEMCRLYEVIPLGNFGEADICIMEGKFFRAGEEAEGYFDPLLG